MYNPRDYESSARDDGNGREAVRQAVVVAQLGGNVGHRSAFLHRIPPLERQQS